MVVPNGSQPPNRGAWPPYFLILLSLRRWRTVILANTNESITRGKHDQRVAEKQAVRLNNILNVLENRNKLGLVVQLHRKNHLVGEHTVYTQY